MDDEELLSIANLSVKLKVSKQTIYNKLDELKELEPFIIIKNNIKYLKPEAIDIIKDNVKVQPKDTIKEDINTIEFFKNELSRKDEIYNKYIDDLRKQYENEIQHLRNESLEKNKLLSERDKLLENMQVLLKDQKLLIERKKYKWWEFWKS